MSATTLVGHQSCESSHRATGILYYQSPINLKESDITFRVLQNIKVTGKIRKTRFDPEHKNYFVLNNVFIEVHGRTYKLIQYHFHALELSEHAINGEKFDAEVHYVFEPENKELKHQETKGNHPHFCSCLCDGRSHSEEEDVFVIGRFITFTKKCTKLADLKKFPLRIPRDYFIYDGTLSTEASSGHGSNNFPPVRWNIGGKPIKVDRDQFRAFNSKPSRKLQPIDNRLVLHTC